MDGDLREANAEIQSGSYFGRFEHPSDIDRMVVDSGVCFFKIAFLLAKEEILPKETVSVQKVVQVSSKVHPEKDWAFIALCDDGSLWLYHGSWLRIENVPQTTDL